MLNRFSLPIDFHELENLYEKMVSEFFDSLSITFPVACNIEYENVVLD